MKLHLPTKLRAALLACVVALSPIAVTIATGSLIIASSPRAFAQGVTETIGESTYTAGNARRRIFGEATIASGEAEALPAIAWTADDTAIMDFTTGFFGGGTYTSNAGTIVVRDWLMTGGSSTFSATFNSDLVSPDDFATMEDSGDIQAGAAQERAWTFNGDHSAFQGDFVNFRNDINNWTINFRNTDATENELAAVSGTGAIRNHADKATARTVLFYQFDDGATPRSATIANSSIEAYDITLQKNGSDATGIDYTVLSSLDVENTFTITDEATATLTHTSNTINSVNIAVANSSLTIGNSTAAAQATVSGAVTNAGSIHVASDSTLTLNGVITGAGTIHVADRGTLNINGTLTAHATPIANAGTLAFGSDVIFDLTALGVQDTYTIFTGGTATGFTSLDVNNLTGVTFTGKTAVFNEDGTISLTLIATEHLITDSPDPIDWGIGSILEAGEEGFAAGDIVRVQGDATLVMTESINATLVTIESSAELTLSSEAGESNQLNSTIAVDGTIILVGDVLHDDATLTSTDTASAGTVRFNIGADNEINYGLQLDDFAGQVVIESGQLTFQGTNDQSSNDTYDIEVLAGATLKIASVSLGQANITLNGASGSADNRANLSIASSAHEQNITANGYTSISVPDAESTIRGLFSTNGDLLVTTGQLLRLNEGLAGSGTITKRGSNTFTIDNGNVSFAGDINIEEGTFQIGNSGADELNPNAISAITVAAGARLYMFHDETDMSSTVLTLNGGTLHNQGMATLTTATDIANLSTYTQMKELRVGADSTISFHFKGRYYFEQMSGDGNLNMTTTNTSTTDNAEVRIIMVNELKDYSGTISHTHADSVAHRLYINQVNLSSSNTASIAAMDVYALDFSMTGAGTLSLGQKLIADSVTLDHQGTLTITGAMETSSFQALNAGTNTSIGTLTLADEGTLFMNYEGGLTITTRSLAANTTLIYSDASNRLHIASGDITGLEKLNVSVLGVSREALAAGYILGIGSDIARDNINILGLTSFDLVQDTASSSWKLTVAEGVEFDFGGWDVNWGIEVLNGAPAVQVPTVIGAAPAGGNSHFALFNNTSSAGVAYTADGITTATITGGGSVLGSSNSSGLVYVYGGATAASVTTNTWINVEGGNLFLIAGGGSSWGDTVANFTGDSHIVLNQDAGAVAYIVGGIHQDFFNPVFTGDSYISVYSNTLLGSIIGGNATIQSGTALTFDGDTHIFIYTALNQTTGLNIHSRSGDMGANQIVGSSARGSSSATNTATVSTHLGDSDVTIDLQGYTGVATTFTKNVMGDSYVTNSHTHNRTGMSTVSITGNALVSFDGRIRGGSYIGSGTNNRTGDTKVIITGNGGTFTERIMGSDEIVNGTTTVSGMSYVEIHGGTFENLVMGGLNQHNGTTTINGTSLSITDGTFEATVMAGHVHAAGSLTNNGGSKLTISGGEFAASVYGGSTSFETSASNITSGLVDINVTGGNLTQSLIGGSQISEGFTGNVEANGGINITINGGATTITGDIIGGHQRATGSANATLSVADVAINLYAGNVNGNVYAAGFLGAAATADTVTTASTAVAIRQEVTFGTGVTIDGGFGGAGASSATVAGSQTLQFEGSGAFFNIADVSFQNFDTVNVVEGAASVSLSLDSAEITKKGSGILELAAGNRASLTVEQGTLKLGADTGNYTLDSVTIQSMAALDLAASNVGISGALTLGGSAVLIADTTKSTALGSLTLSDPASKLTIHFVDRAPGSEFDIELFTGLTESDISGITFRDEFGQRAADADTYFDGLPGYLVLRPDNTLALVSTLITDFIWLGGSGNVSDMNWSAELGGTPIHITNGLSATFVAPAVSGSQPTITVNENLTLKNVTITGSGADFRFNKNDSTTLTINEKLTLHDNTRGIFEFAPVMGATASVEIGTTAVLSYISSDDVSLYALSNKGVITIAAQLSLLTATTQGGTIIGSSLSLAENTNNSFTQLDIGGLVTSTGTLSVGGTSQFGSLSGGGLNIVSGGTLSITNETSISSLVNNGSLSVTSNLAISSAVTTGGTLTVGDPAGAAANLTIAAGNNSFTQLKVTGNVIGNTGTLTIGTDSDIDGSIGSGSLSSSGNVSIGSLAIAGLSNTGTITTTGDVTLSEATTAGGVLNTGSGNITLTGANTFTSLSTTGALSTGATSDSLSVSASSSTGTISEMNLAVTSADAIFSISGTDNVVLSSFSGLGSLALSDSNAQLSLKGASSGKDLTVNSGHLTLGDALSLTGNLTTGSTMNLTLDYQPSIDTAALKANQLSGATSITLGITAERLGDLALSNSTSYSVTDLTTDLSDTVALSFAGSPDGDEWVIGLRTYTLSIVDGELNISVAVDGNQWQGTGTWDDETGDWTAGTPPESTEAFFFGGGSPDVAVLGAKTVTEMEVSDDYHFSGDQITANTLAVTMGTTTISNTISTGSTTIASGAAITLTQKDGAGTRELLTGRLVVNDGATLTIEDGSTTEVGEAGTDARGDVYNQGLFLLRGTATPSDGITEHMIAEVSDNGGDLTNMAGTLSLQDSAEASVGHLRQAHLLIGAGSSISVSKTAVIGNSIENEGLIDASAISFTIISAVQKGGDLNTDHLILYTGGSVFSDLKLNELTFRGPLTSLTRSANTQLTASSLSQLSDSSITLNIDDLTIRLANGTYNLVTTADTSLGWHSVTLGANTARNLNQLIYSGKDVIYNNQAGSLSFTILDATERRWLTSNNYAADPSFTPGDTPDNSISPIMNNVVTDASGKIIGGELASYFILDTVQDILVDESLELDLSKLDLATNNRTGALMRNVSGSASLTLIGKGSDGENTMISKATLENSELTVLDELNLDSIVVDVTGIDPSAKLQLQNLTASNSHIIVDNSGSITVTDQFTMSDDSTIWVDLGGRLEADAVTLNSGSELVGEGTVILGTVIVTSRSELVSHEGSDIRVKKLLMSDNGGASAGGTGVLVTDGGSVVIDEIQGGAINFINGEVTLGSGSYLGNYAIDTIIHASDVGTLALATGETLNLRGQQNANIQLQVKDGVNKLQSLNTSGSHLSIETNGLQLADSSSMSGGSLSFTLNAAEVFDALAADPTDANAEQILSTSSQFTLDGTDIVITQSDSSVLLDVTKVGDTTGRVIADLNATGSVGHITLQGAALSKYFVNVRFSDGQIIADLNTNIYGDLATTANGRAGALMMNEVLFGLNPQLADPSTGQSAHPDLAAVLDSMDDYLATGNTAGADRLAASFAGASVTAMGGAMLGTVERQLSNIRNRAQSMNTMSTHLAETPIYRGWISAEASNSTLDADGTASGYDYSSFGGTVGVDMGEQEHLNYGIALTALYGTLDADGPGAATGDLNTYALSAYAKLSDARWTHSFIASVNIADATHDRTVQHATGSYTTTGDTSGYGVGLMYELAYTYTLSEDKTTLLQPLFNASFVHATLDGYTEQGSDAALTVGEQQSTYLTLGVGSRLQTSFGQSAFNRAAKLSLRAILEADLGDRYTTADMSIAGVNGRQTVTGAEPGKVGVELGVGLSVPVSDVSGTLFFDASLDLRQGQSDINATVGYGFSF